MRIFRGMGRGGEPPFTPLDPRIHTSYEGMKVTSIVRVKQVKLCIFNEKIQLA